MSKRHYDLMPPNGSAPSMLHLQGDISDPKIPVKAFVFPAEVFLQILKSLDGHHLMRQIGLPMDARVVGCALANGLPNTIVLFVTSATWPIIPIGKLPEPAALDIAIEAERVHAEEPEADQPWDISKWPLPNTEKTDVPD